jgi:hypothetical protein
LFAWLLFGEQALRGLGQFQEARSFVEITLVGGLVQGDFLHQLLLLDPPLFGHLHVEGTVNAAIELVDIHGVDAILNTVAFSLQACNRGLVLFFLVGMALAKRRTDPLHHLVGEAQAAKDQGELVRNHLFAHIGFVAFSSIAGAVVVNVSALLEFAHHRAAAMTAIHQTREGEVMLSAAGLFCVATIQHALHPMPKLASNQWLVPTAVVMALPFVLARVDAVAQD